MGSYMVAELLVDYVYIEEVLDYLEEKKEP